VSAGNAHDLRRHAQVKGGTPVTPGRVSVFSGFAGLLFAFVFVFGVVMAAGGVYFEVVTGPWW
jgi:hypothetical protein